MAEYVLEVKGLGHTYTGRDTEYEAIRDITFGVAERQIVSLVGPSGSGKSTTLRALSGLLTPTKGTVSLLGTPIAGVPRQLAMVFQDYGRSLYPWMSVEKNVGFPLTSDKRIDKREIADRVGDCLEAVGLAGHESKYPWQLSGGMQQRVAIARAIAYRPAVLLMDEPFASVDAQTRTDLEDLVLDIRTRYGMTIVFVTHDIDESVYLGDAVVVISAPPACVVANLAVPFGEERDQITTRAQPEFVTLRSNIAELIRKNGRVSTGKS